MLSTIKIKKILLFILIISSFILISEKVSSTDISYQTSGSSAYIQDVQQRSSIEEDNLYSETAINIIINNKTFIAHNPKSYFGLYLKAFEQYRFFPLHNLNISVCEDHISQSSSNFKDILYNCSKPIKHYWLMGDNEDFLQVIINLTDVKSESFSIKIDYLIKDFIIHNGNYEVVWLKNNFQYGGTYLRTLVLPQNNSIIESLHNFKIIAQRDGSWVLELEKKDDALVWYRDAVVEISEKNERDITIVIITLGLSLLFLVLQLFLNRYQLFIALFLLFLGINVILFGLSNLSIRINSSISVITIILMIIFFVKSLQRNEWSNKGTKEKLFNDLFIRKEKVKVIVIKILKNLKDYFKQNE